MEMILVYKMCMAAVRDEVLTPRQWELLDRYVERHVRPTTTDPLLCLIRVRTKILAFLNEYRARHGYNRYIDVFYVWAEMPNE